MALEINGWTAIILSFVTPSMVVAYYVQIAKDYDVPPLLRLSIVLFVVYNVMSALSGISNPASMAPYRDRALSELLLAFVLYWRVLSKRRLQRCQALHLQT